MDRKQPRESRVDARVISLYSKGTADNRLDFRNAYISYMYYLAIDVQPVSIDPLQPFWEDSPLLAAYDNWLPKSNKGSDEERKRDAFRQIVMAFTDVDKTGKNGYTQEEINAFWSDTSPILFISLINVKDADALKDKIQIFRNSESGQTIRTMVYFTFDNCDLILFHKDNCFYNYVEQLFRFCFQKEDSCVVDCMTLLGFRFDEHTPYPEEKFDVLLRYGIQDYSKLPECFSRTLERPSGYILGRSDGAVYYRDVDLKWFAEHVQKFGVENSNNLHNIDFMVIVPSKGQAEAWNYLGSTAPRLMGKERFIEKVRNLRVRFDKSYRDIFSNNEHLKVDEVLLRWLQDSCELACELYNNALSSDIGICLLPQYVNLFTYFLSVLPRQITNDNDLYEHKEYVNNCFIAFFNSILTLMDSMNHSDRQFVQAPSFHSTSFEMPPKLLACLTAATQYLVTALNDNSNNHCFTISPRFAHELDVTRLTVKDDGTDNMLSIGIGESRMYTIAHTILIITHEISHFVGSGNRCRIRRKENIIKTGIHIFLNALVARLSPEDAWQSMTEKESTLRSKRLTGEVVEKTVNDIHKALCNVLPDDYGSASRLYLRDLEEQLYHLPNSISSLPDVTEIVIQWVIQTFFDDSFFNHEIDAGYMAAWHQRIGSQISGKLDAGAKMGIMRGDVLDWFYEQAEIRTDYFSSFDTVSELNNLWNADKMSLGEFICYMYCETFSDLQTILLFELSLEDYLRMLIYVDGKSIRDLSTRLLAVTKTMYGNKGWNDEDIITLKQIGELKEVSGLCDALELVKVDPCKNSDSYGQKRVNATLFRYLTDYLHTCKNTISEFLNKEGNEKSKLARSRLRSLFQKVRSGSNDNFYNNISVCQLEQEIMKFLCEFTKTFEENLP